MTLRCYGWCWKHKACERGFTPGGAGLFECVDGVSVGVAHGDEDEGFEGEAQGSGVEVGAVFADRAGYSSARSGRWHGERLRLTRLESTVSEKRASICSSARTLLSTLLSRVRHKRRDPNRRRRQARASSQVLR